MNKKLALLLLCFVVGCAPNLNTESTKTVQITSTPVPTSTPLPTSTPTITPTSTPIPTPTPAFISYETVFNIVLIEQITGESLSNNKQFNVIAFSPDFNTYATFYYDDKSLIVWDAATGQKISTISTKDFGNMVFSPDGRTIAVVDDQYRIALYESETGDLIQALPCRGYNAVFSSDGKIIFTSYEACDVATGQLLYALDVPRDLISYNVAVSADGKLLATTADVGRTKGTHEVILWDAVTGKQIARLDGNIYPAHVSDSFPILAIAFSPDGKYIASTDSQNTTIIWNLATREEISVFDPISRKAGIRSIESSQSVAFSPDSKMLVVGYSFGSIIFLDIVTGKPIQTIRANVPQSGMVWDEKNGIGLIAFSADGSKLVTVPSAASKLFFVSPVDSPVTIWGLSSDTKATPSPTLDLLASKVILDVSGVYAPLNAPPSRYTTDFYNFSADIGTYTVELNTDNNSNICYLNWQVRPSSNPTNGQTDKFGDSNTPGTFTINQRGDYAISIVRARISNQCQEFSYTLKVTQQ